MLMKIKNNLILVLMLIVLSSSVFSFTLDFEDKYGSLTEEYQFGTFTDKFVFEDEEFNINLTAFSSSETMLCVEW